MKIIWGMLEPLQEYQIIAKKFNEQIQQLTNGQVEIEIKLFQEDPANPMKEIEEGNLDIYQVPSTQLRQLMPEQKWLEAWEIPFLFKNNAHLEAYIESEHTRENLKNIETDAILPLTYSYAGGFCSVVSKRNKEKIQDFKNLNFIQYSKFEYEDMTLPDFLMNIYQYLPAGILMYEINELLKLKPEIKSYLNVDITKHLVVARITMLSKALLEKIPAQYKEKIVHMLSDLLREERQVIYNRSAMNVLALKADGHIGFNEVITLDEKLNKEILFVNSLDK